LSSIQSPPDEFLPVDRKQNAMIEEPFILSIGSLWKYNGFDVLIAAFKEVLEKGYKCKLVIIGDGYERRYLQNLAVLLGISNEVGFLSGLQKGQIDRLLERSLFYVRTPRIDPISEIYPRVLRLRKPILSTVGLTDNGLKNSETKMMLVRNDTRSIADGIIAMLDGKEQKTHFVNGKGELSKAYVFSLGRFVSYKRFDIIIRAFKRIIDEHFDVNLLIGGEGKDLNYYEELVESSDLQERVFFLGLLDRGRVIRFYKKCQIFVSAFENEPFGLSAVEAMAMGKPVVVPRTGAMPELIKDGFNGIMVEAGSEVAMSGAILRLLGDKSLRDELGSQARNSVKVKYRWDNISGSYLSQFRNLTSSFLQ